MENGRVFKAASFFHDVPTIIVVVVGFSFVANCIVTVIYFFLSVSSISLSSLFIRISLFVVTKASPCTGENTCYFSKITLQLSCLLLWFSDMWCLILLPLKCSRVVDAKSPLAVVIPTRGSGFSMELRDGDLSWHDFLERVNSLKYALNPDLFREVQFISNI